MLLQGLGYAFLLMGTAMSGVIIFHDDFGSGSELLPIRMLGVAVLLASWAVSALMIVIGSYVGDRVEESIDVSADAVER